MSDFFLTYTPLDVDQVRGVQGRYFAEPIGHPPLHMRKHDWSLSHQRLVRAVDDLRMWGAPSAIATKPPRHSRRRPIVSSATPLEEPDKLAGRFPLESTRLEEKPLKRDNC